MKKILTLFVAIILLAGCGSKKIAWEDVSGSYDALYKETIEVAAAYDSYSAAEFKVLTSSIIEKADAVKSGVSEEDEESLRSLYKDAVLLEQLSMQSNSIEADTLGKLSLNIEELIKVAYEKEDLEALKKEIADKASVIGSWDDSNWALVEKRKKILWADVEAEYAKLEEDTIAALPRAYQLTETDLEGFKDTILNNYTMIENGVYEENKENADVIYEAAVSLRYYLEDLEGDEPEKVLSFANGAIDYVKQAYGVTPADMGFDFSAAAKEAEKWTLSLWNELIKLLNL